MPSKLRFAFHDVVKHLIFQFTFKQYEYLNTTDMLAWYLHKH